MIFYAEVQNQLTQFFTDLEYSKLFVLTDSNTTAHCLSVIKSALPEYTHLEMEAGEHHKNLSTCSKLWEQMLQKNADRNSFLLNVGGGVVTDLGGFVAGCYKRGIRYANIPTSLLAMVDASVGSKTGIDFNAVKNSIGLFLSAEAVFIDPVFLSTLPKRQLNNGKAEMLKHGLIANKDHFKTISNADTEHISLQHIETSVSIKANVVAQDPTETGLRKILNFGHTLGHAIEAYSLQQQTNYLLHGEAIVIGMLAEAYLSMNYSNLKQKDFDTITDSLLQTFTIPKFSEKDVNQMICYLKNDKKNAGSKLQMSLISAIGEAQYNVHVTEQDAFDALLYTFKTFSQ